MDQLPEFIEGVQAIRLQPTDTVVLRVDRVLTREQEIEAAELAEALFPHNKVAVLQRGESIEVYRDDESPAPAA